MQKKVKRSYLKSVRRNRCTVLLVLIYTLLFLLNFLLYDYIFDTVRLNAFLKDCDYDYVGISNVRVKDEDVYAYYGKDLFVAKGFEELESHSVSYIDTVNAVCIQELLDVVYTEISPINTQNVLEGEYSRLKSGEVAVSAKVAETLNVTVGDEMCVSSMNGPIVLTIKYVYEELYTLFDININKEVYSVMLSAEDTFAASGFSYLHYDNAANTYMAIYLRSNEIDSLGNTYAVLGIGVCIAISALASAMFWLLNRNVRMKAVKMRSYGWSRASVFAIQLYRIALALVPALLLVALFGWCVGVQLFFYGMLVIQAVIITVVQSILSC